jgi:hypothetical protein
VWFDVLKDYFGVKKLFLEPKNITVDESKAEYAVELGSFTTADEREVGIFEVKLQPQVWIERNRVGLRSLLRQVYKYDVDGALIVFQQDHKWRFSYVSEIRTEDGKKETEPKRYTYLFGKGESCRTAAERFDKLKGKPIHLNDLYEAFSVEKLNKDFFKTYKEFNEKFWKYLAEPKNGYRKLFIDEKYEEVERQEKPIRDFTKKLLGRIVFLHFLQKKGWMGVPVTNHEWKEGDARFMQNLFANCKDKVTFHSKVLKTLFFKTLNTKRDNDVAHASLGKNIRIPYLNGGLFDKDISFDNDIDFPAEYFSGLLDFFEQYNFTIDENDPYDSEVGIDPEMLGHIFENLLEENREKGAFYTPKEIVHYMCQESLLQYLRTHLPECTEDDSPATIALQNFIRKGETGDRTDRKNFVVQQAKRIEKLLDNVKVCDPAIGSGAFPMGMLQEIYKAKTALDLTLDRTEVKKRIIQDSIYGVDIENGAVEIARLRFWLALVVDETEPQPLPNLDYKIMQGNSLLESFEGVDLSSLGNLDNKEEQDILFAQKGQYEIGAEFSKTKQSLLVFDQKSKNELYELIDDYFNYDETSNTKYKSKQFIKNEINRIVEGKLIAKFFLEKPKLELKINDLKDAIKTTRLLTTDSPGAKLKKEKTKEKLNQELNKIESELEKLNNIIDQLHELQTRTDKPYFLWHLWFKEVFDRGGFDIVIGNPPYINVENLDAVTKNQLFRYYETCKGRTDIYIAFLEGMLQLLKVSGNLSYIIPFPYTNQNYGSLSRKMLIEKYHIQEVVDTSDYFVFESATVKNIILNVVKSKSIKNTKIKKAVSAKDFIEGVFKEFSVSQKSFLALKDFRIETKQISQYAGIKDKLWETSKRLDDICLIAYGARLNYKSKNIGKEEFISKEFKKGYKPFTEGKNIERYSFKQFGWLNYQPALHYNPMFSELFENEKLIFINVVKDKLRFAWDKKSFYNSHTVINCVKWNLLKNARHVTVRRNISDEKIELSKNVNYSYLLGILNSTLINWYFVTFLSESLHFYPDDAKELPIAISNKKLKDKICEIVESVIKLKEAGNNQTMFYENKIDALVFHLYGLTENEMVQVLDSFKDLSIKDRNQIQNEYWNIANNKFKIEA